MYVSLAVPSQQTRDIHPMLFQCWLIVSDAGPTLKHHWVNAPCFLGFHPANSGSSSIAGLLLSQRRRPWPNTNPAMGEYLAFTRYSVPGVIYLLALATAPIIIDQLLYTVGDIRGGRGGGGLMGVMFDINEVFVVDNHSYPLTIIILQA